MLKYGKSKTLAAPIASAKYETATTAKIPGIACGSAAETKGAQRDARLSILAHLSVRGSLPMSRRC